MLATPELIAETGLAERLTDVLPRYLDTVPLYHQNAGAPAFEAPQEAMKALHRLPLITKQDIRRGFPRNFVESEEALEALVDAERVELEQTSGTSEERTPLLLPRGWWAEQEERALRLNSLVATVLDEHPGARRVAINSPVCSGDICYSGVPSHNERIVDNTLFVSLSRYPFLWSESELSRMAAETLDWQPQFLDVDPVYGAVFALYCERRGIRLPSLRFVVCSYEFVSVAHRRILSRVFGVPVFDLYGSTETGHLLMEDERGEMRPSLETALLEVLEQDAAGVGSLVVTTLTNDFMPLLRYRIGDLVERVELPYRTRYLVHGRAADAFQTPRGARVTTWHVDECFADVEGIAHYQLTQRADGPWLLRFVPDRSGPEPASLAELQHRLTSLLELRHGLEVNRTDMLVPESSGKFRLGYPRQAAREPGAEGS
jgi:phenylacetate-CoA ligase